MMLEGKVVVVTGGAGLIGREFVRAIAREGGRAIIADVDAGAAERVATTLHGEGVTRVDVEQMNITSRESIVSAIDAIRSRHGRIDAVVNNAYPRNARYGRRLEQVEYADFNENVSLHLGGYFLVSQQFAALFAQHGGGTIVNMASVYGVIAPRFDIYDETSMTMPVEYAAIKAGIIHLTRYFAQYYKGRGVRVNSLSPGGVLDNQPEAFLARYREHAASKGMLDAADLTGALVFLLSEQSAYVNGQNLIVDDGWTL